MKNDSHLPPGQTETRKFPVVGERLPPATLDLVTWQLSITGSVTQPLHFSLAEFMALPQQDFTMDIHCVTSWSLFGQTFTGVPLRTILSNAQPDSDASFIRFIAYSDRKHDTSLPLEYALENCWLVHSINGDALTPAHGAPLRVVTQGKYFYKSLKWVREIQLLMADKLGYWEANSAYHNEADPWLEQRYDHSLKTSAAEVAALKAATDFSGYQDQVILSANLANWRPQSHDLRGVQLKACNFRNANLENIDFRGANLTFGDFGRANCRNVDFTNADLEGADFSGADLTNATIVDAALSATKFFRDTKSGKRIAAKVTGLTLKNPHGLLESQADFLRENNVKFV